MPGLRLPAACLSEARPAVQTVFLMRFLAGAFLAGPGTPPHPRQVALGALGWTCSTIAIYVFNGIADRQEDTENGSRRPIASGRLPVRYAARATVLCAVVGLICAWGLGLAEGLWATVFLLLGYAYSGPPFPLKRRHYAASLSGAGLGLVTYLAGSAAAGTRESGTFMAFAAVMSLWMGGIGGIAKDLSDVAGDRAAGRRTLPIIVGERRARRLLAVAAPGVALGFAAVAVWSFGTLLWCAGTVLLGAVAVAGLSMDPNMQDSKARRRLPYRAFMCTQHATHMVLAVKLWTL